ncbi:TonB-dependent receptor [Sphingomonas sp. Sphisp140]|uniref:TonB-dependent receptor n=1 Tax=unclassified Sphingomonas TaxID=196159 RepID=UPI0039AF48EF
MRTAKTRFLARPALAALALSIAAPAFAQEQAAPAAGAQDAPQDIVVTGQRAAQRAANLEKRDADNTVETLHANDVGKLPDQNVAEAIKRLPGLSVANDQGEGRYVIIRGIDPNLINVTLNGQTLPAPEPAGRQVKLDDLPSGMIQSVTVSKSLLASQDANAVGGEVNIRTKTGFDSRTPFFFDARGAIGRYDMNHKAPWELDATLGGHTDTLGAVVSVNYSRRPIETENYQGSAAWNSAGTPDGNGLRDYNLTRTRLGVVGNFDWHPSDGVKLYLRTSYSKFQDHETRDQNRLAITTFTPGTLKATGTILVRRREEDDNTKSATLGGEFDLGGGKLEASGGWTRAVKIDPIRSEFTFGTSKGGVSASFDNSTDPYTLAPGGTSAGVFDDPSQFKLTKFNYETRQASEDLWQGRLDYTLPISVGEDSAIKVGFKYLDRRKKNNQDKRNYKNGATAWTMTNVAYAADPSFYDGQFHFGDRIDYAAALAYTNANPGVLAIDNAGTLADSLSSDYDVREKITAGYAMATLRFGALTLIPGVRVEHTDDDIRAKIVQSGSTLADGYSSHGENGYTDFFPGLNAKFEMAHNLFLRGALTTAIGRPNYADLAPYITVDSGAAPTAIALGNPDLKPYRAVNYDASIEYYPTPDSLFVAGFFHKDIDNPIYKSGSLVTNGVYGGVTYASALVTKPINVDSETLSGVEFNLQTQFTFLPGPLSGFGVSANFTHVWGHANGIGNRGDLPLAFQSKNVGNVQLFYEKYGIAARLAFNYRSSYLDTLNLPAASGDQFTDGNGQLDLHVSYQVMPEVTVFGDAVNLTNAPWRRYIGSKQFLVEREQYGALLRGGVQLHF